MARPINVARWLSRSRANGPGERFVLWVQGCGLACPGCWNPDTWTFAPRLLRTADELLAAVDQAEDIEGVTLSGGEPFSQAEALLPFVAGLRQRGLSLLVFTGFTLAELRSEAARQLLSQVDVLVAGRYDRTRAASQLPLLGSHNQQVLRLTERYTMEELASVPVCETHIDEDGTVRWTGFPGELLEGET